MDRSLVFYPHLTPLLIVHRNPGGIISLTVRWLSWGKGGLAQVSFIHILLQTQFWFKSRLRIWSPKALSF